MRPTKKTVSSSTALLLLWASLPLITSVNWLIRYESLKNTCPTTNPGYVEIDGIALNTCLNYGGNGYTSKYSCDLSTKMSIQTVYHSTNCNTSTYAFTNNYPLDQCTPYEENGAPLYYYGYTCATEPFSNFTQPYVVDAKYSDTQCKNLLYYFANPNLQCAPLWTMSSDFYTYPHVCSYSAGNCVGTCTDYYLNATCTKTGSGDVSKGARMSSYQVVLIDASSNPQTTNNSKDEWYSSTGAVVGFTIGGVALIVIIVAVVFFATASGWKVIRHAGGTRTERKSLVELDSTVSALRKSHDASMNHNQA